MDDVAKSPQEYLAVLMRRRWQFILPAVIGVLLSAAIAFLLPPVYRSSATVLIEEPEVPRELVQSTITSFADQRLQIITRRVMTTQNLIGIIQRYGLFMEARARDPMTVLAEQFRDAIEMEMISADVVDPRSGRQMAATIAFTLSFEHNDPRVAQKIVNELVSLYLTENLRDRREKAADTNEFLGQEANRLSRMVGAVEQKIATFKAENAGTLPEQLELNLRLADRTERELSDMQSRLRALEQRRIYLEGELAWISPFGTIVLDGETILSPTDTLKALQTRLVSLRGVYGDAHPDVTRLKREIEALEVETSASPDYGTIERQLSDARVELAVARERFGDGHPDVAGLERRVAIYGSELESARLADVPLKRDIIKPDNPAYIQLRSQRQAVETESRALEGQVAVLRAARDKYEQRILLTPEVERAYLQLNRDYENAHAKFQEVRAKQLEAELAQSLEAEHKSERFSLIEPPQLPISPSKPNRPAILLLGAVLSIAAGAGLVFLADSMDRTIYSARDIERLCSEPPLVVVPYMRNRADARRRLRMVGAGVGGATAAIMTTLYLAHTQLAPLDVLWFNGLRHLGAG